MRSTSNNCLRRALRAAATRSTELTVRKAAIAGFALLALVACVHAPSEPVARPFDYLGELREAESAYAALAGSKDDSSESISLGRKSAALQRLGIARSWVGDTVGALDAFDEAFYIKANLATDKPKQGRDAARALLVDHEVENAIAVIVREARNRQIVILNEAHHMPRDRAVGLDVARELRKLGFEYLAMETLAPAVDDLARRGYPVDATGHYSREPVFGDYIRQSLALGYKPVAYEQSAELLERKYPDMFASIDAREEAQAQNLVDRVFKDHPQARVLIHVGYGHLAKGLTEMGDGRKVAWMAERLRSKTGIDPLCIDQANAAQSAPFTVRALETVAFEARDDATIVLRDLRKDHEYWPGGRGVDMQVIHRTARLVDGRPDWLSMHGLRQPRPIPAKLLPRSGRRLVQAFVAGESADAVPIDQVLVTAGEPPPVLMLPKGKFRFAYQD
jgi:hypothetical protein